MKASGWVCLIWFGAALILMTAVGAQAAYVAPEVTRILGMLFLLYLWFVAMPGTVVWLIEPPGK